MLIFILENINSFKVFNYSIVQNIIYLIIVFKFNLLSYFSLLNIIFTFYTIKYVYINKTLIYSFKFIITILFLIFIRAGIPRYRYDYLTILGWNRFFFLSFGIFFLLIILYIIN